jgi:prophage tail gpP-like protein
VTPKIRIVTASGDIQDWTSLEIRKSLDHVASAFFISCRDSWTSEHTKWPFAEGDVCKMFVDNALILEGFIDVIETHLSDCDHDVQIAGRDRIGDLVDCAYTGASDEFKGKQTLLDIASLMAKPFHVQVSAKDVNLPSLQTWKVDPGETIIENLERAARKCGVLLQSNGLSELQIVEASKTVRDIALVEGVNIKEVQACYDNSLRFSQYIVKGQSKKNSKISKEALDKGISRRRPYVLLAEGRLTDEDAQRRANWEAAVRAARAVRICITTNGWRDSSGEIWSTNQIVKVYAPHARVFGEPLLICDVILSIDSNAGTTTSITLSRPDAYQPKPVIEPMKKNNSDDELLKKMGYR